MNHSFKWVIEKTSMLIHKRIATNHRQGLHSFQLRRRSHDNQTTNNSLHSSVRKVIVFHSYRAAWWGGVKGRNDREVVGNGKGGKDIRLSERSKPWISLHFKTRPELILLYNLCKKYKQQLANFITNGIHVPSGAPVMDHLKSHSQNLEGSRPVMCMQTIVL